MPDVAVTVFIDYTPGVGYGWVHYGDDGSKISSMFNAGAQDWAAQLYKAGQKQETPPAKDGKHGKQKQALVGGTGKRPVLRGKVHSSDSGARKLTAKGKR